MKLPTAKEILNRKNWTGLTLKELVQAGRVQPNTGAASAIEAIQQEYFDAGNIVPYDQADKYIRKWDDLEMDLLALLVQVQADAE